jgi:hypothetical protein
VCNTSVEGAAEGGIFRSDQARISVENSIRVHACLEEQLGVLM